MADSSPEPNWRLPLDIRFCSFAHLLCTVFGGQEAARVRHPRFDSNPRSRALFARCGLIGRYAVSEIVPAELLSSETPVAFYGYARAKEGTRHILMERMLSLGDPSRAEPGILVYEIHHDASRPDSIAFYELYANGAAIREHLEKPYMKAFSPIARHCCSRTSKSSLSSPSAPWQQSRLTAPVDPTSLSYESSDGRAGAERGIGPSVRGVSRSPTRHRAANLEGLPNAVAHHSCCHCMCQSDHTPPRHRIDPKNLYKYRSRTSQCKIFSRGSERHTTRAV